MSSEGMEELAQLFAGLKFRKKIIGGVSEADVWKKLEQVQNEYRRICECQAAGYEARLQEREDRIRQLERELSEREFSKKERSGHDLSKGESSEKMVGESHSLKPGKASLEGKIHE